MKIEDLEEDIESGKLDETMLTSELAKEESVSRVLKHKNLLLEMAPTFDDELLLKLFEALHIYNSKEKNKSYISVVNLISTVCINPYNALRFVDLFSFLLFVFPRRSKISNESLAPNNANALVEQNVLIFDKSLNFRAEVDNKYWKASNYVEVL